jgi:hypothetical protein
MADGTYIRNMHKVLSYVLETLSSYATESKPQNAV